MIRSILALVAAILTATAASAAPPSVSLVASRTSGTAPLCVHFDAVATTDDGTTRPFHDLLYRWSFGNTSAGAWGVGANPSFNRNTARGPVAAHCYMQPGTYRTVLQVTDSAGETASRTVVITVADPNTVFSGTNTVCVGNTTPVAGSGGCPAGAAVVASADFDATQLTYLTTGKRVLFRRGDTFTSNASWSSANKTGWQVGAFGTGNRPRINFDLASNSAYLFEFDLTATYDVVIQDLDIVGPAVADRGGCFKAQTTESIRVSILNNRCYEAGQGNGSSGTSRMTEWFVVGNDLRDPASGASWYGYTKKSAYMANLTGSRFPYPQEHGIRLQHAVRVLVSHNEFERVSPTKGNLTIRGGAHGATGAWSEETDTQYVYVSDNKLDVRGGTDNGPMGFTPSSVDDCQWGRNAIFERNFIRSTTSNNAAMQTVWPDFTARNNIIVIEADGSEQSPLFFLSNSTNDGTCAGGGLTPLPEQAARSHFVNNTMYERSVGAGGGMGDPARFGFGTGSNIATDPVYRNNLTWMPNNTRTTVRLPYLYNVTGTVVNSNNSTGSADGNSARATNPQWAVADPVDPIQFRPAVGSYATAGGVASFPATAEDFFLCRDRTGAARMGAVVPRARAQCIGGAQ